MKIENTCVVGFIPAFRALRNPRNSWDKSDSTIGKSTEIAPEGFVIGEKDLELARKLIKAGSEHRKFIRLIGVSVDIIGPRYWLTEMDTYKVGVVRVSCSSFAKLGQSILTPEDFQDGDVSQNTLDELNDLAKKYLETKDLDFLRRYKKRLSEGYLQRSTFDMNYEVLINMYHQRKNHKLLEWHTICDWIYSLPYMKELME